MIRTTRAALPLLRKATFARVVNVAASSIRHQSPGLIGFTAAEGGDGERVEEPLAGARARGDHRQHRRAGHRDVAHAGRLPRGHRPRGPARGPARSRLRGDRPRLRRVERHRPGRAPRGGRARWSCSSAPSSAASWSGATDRRSTAAPTSSDGFSSPRVRSARDGVQPRRPVGSASPTRSPTAKRSSAASAASRYADADERATRLAHHLAARGIGAGDHVALYLYNGTEYLEGMLAAFKLRAVPINVNYRYVEDELRYLLDDCDAKADRVPPRVRADARRDRARDLPLLTHVRRGRRRLRRGRPLAGAAEYEAALAARRPTRDFGPRSADDLYILYTGGTTGKPEGRDVARRGHLLRRVRRREPRRRADHDARADRRRSSTSHRRGAARRARSCTAPRTGWRSARSTPAAPW